MGVQSIQSPDDDGTVFSKESWINRQKIKVLKLRDPKPLQALKIIHPTLEQFIGIILLSPIIMILIIKEIAPLMPSEPFIASIQNGPQQKI